MAERKSDPKANEKEQKLKYSNDAKRNCRSESYSTYRNEYYNMNHKYRGKAIIFSHDHFEIKLPPRPGTRKDCDNLDKCLKELGFCVDVFHNLRYAEIMKHIEQTAQMNHSKNDCLLIVVLTHGMSGMLYAKDTHYRSEKLWCRFTEENCCTLAGKPKLFFFQACQGSQYDEGVTLSNSVETDGWFEPHKNPTYPDFLLVLSTVPGYFSWRNTERGSWFVQALCEELCYYAADTDILTLLTFVSQKVALNFESNTPDVVDSHEKKQVPSISSMLTRRLVFTKKPDISLSKMNSFLKHFTECSLKN